MRKILIVEDDPSISLLLVRTLSMVGFSIVCSESLSEAMNHVCNGTFDLIILDLSLPDGDGLELLKDNNIPVIILTAKNQLHDKIRGLSSGADDYLTKPFEPAELIARINAVMRRYHPNDRAEHHFDDIYINSNQRIVERKSQRMDLTPREFDLLCYLVENGGYALKRDRIIEQVWGYDSECTSRTVDIHVQRLRKKLETDRIETVYKIGYRFNNR